MSSLLVPLLPPTNLYGNGSDATSIYLSWDNIPLKGQKGVIQGYRVVYRKVLRNNLIAIENFLNVHSSAPFEVTLVNLMRDSEYSITVAGYTNAGIGVPSKAIAVATGKYGEYFISMFL